MSGCLLPTISFDIFWKLSTITSLPSAMNLFLVLTDMVDKRKSKIYRRTGYDKETGASFRRTKKDQSFMNYNFKKNMKIIWICAVAPLLFIFVYAVSKDFSPLFRSPYYDCAISVLTYFGLTPMVISTILLFIIGWKFISTM